MRALAPSVAEFILRLWLGERLLGPLKAVAFPSPLSLLPGNWEVSSFPLLQPRGLLLLCYMSKSNGHDCPMSKSNDDDCPHTENSETMNFTGDFLIFKLLSQESCHHDGRANKITTSEEDGRPCGWRIFSMCSTVFTLRQFFTYLYCHHPLLSSLHA